MHETGVTAMRRTFLALAALCLSAALHAGEIEGFTPETGRTVAIGGPHAALADDFSALFANPACLVSVPRELYISRLDIRATGPVLDIASALLSGGDMTASLLDLLAANGYKFYAGADIAGPIAFGYAGGGLGFGLFNGTKVSLNAASATSIAVSAKENLLLAGGYSFRVGLGGGHALDFGLSAKGFARGEISKSLGAIELMGVMQDPMALLDLPFTLTTGVGLDAGLRWNWDEVLSAGLACRDAYSPVLVTTYDDASSFIANPAAAHPVSTSGVLDPDLAFGLAFTPRLGRLGRYLDSLSVALDYRDLLDLLEPLPRNPILNVGLGLELRALDVLSFRAGISETLLSAGLGLDLDFMRIELAAFGRELGIEPGQRPVYNLEASFDFSY